MIRHFFCMADTEQEFNFGVICIGQWPATSFGHCNAKNYCAIIAARSVEQSNFQ